MNRAQARSLFSSRLSVVPSEECQLQDGCALHAARGSGRGFVRPGQGTVPEPRALLYCLMAHGGFSSSSYHAYWFRILWEAFSSDYLFPVRTFDMHSASLSRQYISSQSSTWGRLTFNYLPTYCSHTMSLHTSRAQKCHGSSLGEYGLCCRGSSLTFGKHNHVPSHAKVRMTPSEMSARS